MRTRGVQEAGKEAPKNLVGDEIHRAGYVDSISRSEILTPGSSLGSLNRRAPSP